MKVIQPTDFCPINEILTGKSIFIIPNFQRPYVWGKRQFIDLFKDLEKAAQIVQNEGFHYLSAIHVLKLNTDDWADLIDENKNDDCRKLKNNNADIFGNPYPIYAVVDGQQRLTTIFLLAHVLSKMQQPMLLNNLFATLQLGGKVPRLIQSPSDDHLYMKQMLADYEKGNNVANTKSAAQKRLKEGLELTDGWATNNNSAIAFLLADGLKTSVIRLESNYGLTSFLTLNDRGKPLTVLERLKAAILQAVFEAGADSVTTFANRLHSAFGRIYKVLDKLCHTGLFRDGEEGDREIVKLISCYLRLDTDAKSIWQGGDAAYEEFFRYTLSNTNISLTLTNWLTAIEEIGEGMEHLSDCLSDSSNSPSIFFPNNGYLVDDYKAIFLSLKLQTHLLALLLKFRVLTNKQSWHTRYPITVAPPTALVKIIHDYLQDVRREAQAKLAHAQVLTYLDQFQNQLEDINPRCELSMLEAVERMQILNWNLGNRWYETFRKSCKTSLNTGIAEDIVGYWFQWCSGHAFLSNVLIGWNDTNFRYLLREIERSYGQNIHNNGDLQLEHILPQAPDAEPRFIAIGGYTALDYADKEEYRNQGVLRSGNLTWLTASCNASLGNSMPDDKAAEYISCTRHSGGGFLGSSSIKITRKVGTELTPVKQNYRSYRWIISTRCVELALFSIERFI